MKKNKENKVHYFKLSDPYGDFTQEELDTITQKKPAELNVFDFMCVFQGSLPAGTYSECKQFLPYVYKYIENSKEPGICDVCNNLIHWIKKNKTLLIQDGMYDNAIHSLVMIATNMLENFTISEGYPENLSVVEDIIFTFNALDDYDNLGDKILSDTLLPFSSYAQVAWTCYLLYDVIGYPGLYISPFLMSLKNDDLMRKQMFNLLVEYSYNDDSQLNFWNDIFVQIGLF